MRSTTMFLLGIALISGLILFNKLHAEVTLEQTVIQRQVIPPPSALNNPEKYYKSWEKNTGIKERKPSIMKKRIEQAIGESIYMGTHRYIYRIKSVRIIRVTPRGGNNPVNQNAPVWNIHDSSGTHTFASGEDYDNYINGESSSSTSSSTSSSSSPTSSSSEECVAQCTGQEPTSLSNVDTWTRFCVFPNGVLNKYTLSNDNGAPPPGGSSCEFYTKYDGATGKIAVTALPGIQITKGTSPVSPGTYIYEIKDDGINKRYRVNLTLDKRTLANGKTRITTTINSVCELP